MKFLPSIQHSFVLVFFIAAVSACGSNSKPETEAISTKVPEEQHEVVATEVFLSEAQYKTADILLGNVEMKQISGTFKVNGVLDVPPQQQVSISIPMGGFLKKTDMLQGMRVKKGQLIAVIENPDYVQMQQDYLEAKSQLEYADADYERQQELAKENVNAQKTLQAAKASYQTLTARVNALKEKIRASGISLSAVDKGTIQSAINIYSPINGYVTEVNANIGRFINATDVLFEIVDTEHLHAELTVFEKDIPKLQIGQKIRFTLANETKERTAKVYLIGRKINSDRTVRIHCHIDVEDVHLLPGMFLKAIVESGQVQVNAVPNTAIVDYQGQKYIFIKETPANAVVKTPGKEKEGETMHTEEAHHFKIVPVTIGSSDGGYTEINLPEDFNKAKEQVVFIGAYDLLSKMKNSEEEGHGH